MVMVGTQLVDLKSTMQSQAPQQMISARVSQDLQDKTSGQQNTMTQSFNFTNHDLTGMECNEYALL